MLELFTDLLLKTYLKIVFRKFCILQQQHILKRNLYIYECDIDSF